MQSLAQSLKPNASKHEKVDRIGSAFLVALEEAGAATGTLAHARKVWEWVVDEAKAQSGAAALSHSDLIKRSVAVALVNRIRASRSVGHRMSLAVRCYNYLHTGQLSGPTAIPECEWVRQYARHGHRPPPNAPADRRIPLNPQLDHEFASQFVRYLEEKRFRWGRRALYMARGFLSWLTTHEKEFECISPVDVDMGQIQRHHLDDYRWFLHDQYLTGTIAKGTFRLRVQGVRRWFAYLYSRRMLRRDPAMHLEPVPGKDPISDRRLEPEQVTAFLDSLFVHSRHPLRDAALFGCYVCLGLRPAEAAGLGLRDVDFGNATMKVLGKGQKERIVPIPGPLLQDLERYVASLPDANPAADRALWIDSRGGALGYESIRKLFHRFKHMAHIEKAVGGPHVFRHILATEMANRGEDLEDVSELLGHVSLRHLQPYLHATDEMIAAQLRRLEGEESCH